MTVCLSHVFHTCATQVNNTYVHSAEVDYILNVLLPLLIHQLKIPAHKIGIITPYLYQVVIRHSYYAYMVLQIGRIKLKRYKIQKKMLSNNIFGVKVSTVDGFQGSEKDIIIVSTVRNNIECKKTIQSVHF